MVASQLMAGYDYDEELDTHCSFIYKLLSKHVVGPKSYEPQKNVQHLPSAASTTSHVQLAAGHKNTHSQEANSSCFRASKPTLIHVARRVSKGACLTQAATAFLAISSTPS
jgi:hypothetical protein